MAMAQFDVYENPNVAQREAFPYLVVMQSDQLGHHSTRFAMPLSRLHRPPASAPRRLSQAVNVLGQTLYPAAHLCGAWPSQVLRQPVDSMRAQADVLRDALDAVVSGV
jgi:toxin CcdB